MSLPPETINNINNNNNYDLIYITLDGKINIIKKDVWQKQNIFDGTDSSIITPKNNIFNVSKITQINTGEFVYLGDDCNVYKVGSNFINPEIKSDKKFSGITQLSNYKILLTSKDGKMYTVDDINNFDNTINQFLDDSTIYSSVKQTFDGYVVAIDGTDTMKSSTNNGLGYITAGNGAQCGYAWRFDLVKNQLLNKTKINLDEGMTNRVTLFLPDQTALFNINCDPRYKNRIIKYNFSDKTIKTKYDTRCADGSEYADDILRGPSCFIKCTTGYSSIKDDYTSCWQKCRDGYTLFGGVCYLDESTTYDRGVGVIPDSKCTGCGCIKSTVKKTCPSGLRNDGINCWDDLKTTCTPIKTTKCSYNIKTCPFGSKTTGGDCKTTGCGCIKQKADAQPCPSGQRSDGISCWDDLKCTSSCKSNRNLEDGMCYIPCRDGYKGAVTMCSNTKAWTYIPNTKVRYYDGEPSTPSPITCGTNCCMFDLTFYNPLYTKPIDIILPNLPILEGLVGYYDASSFKNNIWYDSSPSNNNAVYTKGSFENNGTYISGSTSSSILFPVQILPPEYTVFNIGKYNGSVKEKILSGYLNNWFSGFANGLSGVAGRDKPITQTTLSAFDNNWVFSVDTKTTYGANGTYYNTLTSTDSRTQLSINLNDIPAYNSDFAIACVIVFNRTLSNDEILSMQSWLTTKYADLYADTYTKTLGQLGYSCFNGSIGKVTNNYNNYTYASYKNGTVGCEWLNLPEKKNFNPLICTTVSSENYETFDNLSNNNYFPDYIFYPLIIILIFIILYKRNHKD